MQRPDLRGMVARRSILTDPYQRSRESYRVTRVPRKFDRWRVSGLWVTPQQRVLRSTILDLGAVAPPLVLLISNHRIINHFTCSNGR
jgi:hypothetical protein